MESYHALFAYDFQYFKKNLKTLYFIHLPVIVFIVLLVLISYNPFRMSSHICSVVIKLLLLHRDIIISNFGALISVLALSSHFCPRFVRMKMGLLTFCWRAFSLKKLTFLPWLKSVELFLSSPIRFSGLVRSQYYCYANKLLNPEKNMHATKQ